MRRFIAILSAAVVLQVGIGCKHVGGKCDCGVQPGEAHAYSPTATYNGNSSILGNSSLPPSQGAMSMPK